MLLGLVLSLLMVVSLNLAAASYVISYFIVSIGYGILFEWIWRGQTIGKRLLRLRVMDVEGNAAPSSIRSSCGTCCGFVDSVAGLLFCRRGYLLAPTPKASGSVTSPPTPSSSAIHASPEPDLDQMLAEQILLAPPVPPSGRAPPARNVTPAEADIALQSLLRREEFDPVSRVEIVPANWPPIFMPQVEFPAEATERRGRQRKQFLRNIVGT